MLARLAHVDLTTVSQDARQQAEQAVALVAERLEGGRTAAREIVLTPTLVVRGTTAPPRANAEGVNAAGLAQRQPRIGQHDRAVTADERELVTARKVQSHVDRLHHQGADARLPASASREHHPSRLTHPCRALPLCSDTDGPSRLPKQHRWSFEVGQVRGYPPAKPREAGRTLPWHARGDECPGTRVVEGVHVAADHADRAGCPALAGAAAACAHARWRGAGGVSGNIVPWLRTCLGRSAEMSLAGSACTIAAETIIAASFADVTTKSVADLGLGGLGGPGGT